MLGNEENENYKKVTRGESRVDVRTQCIIMTVVGSGCHQKRKLIEFESSCIVISFLYIYLFIDAKRSFINLETS